MKVSMGQPNDLLLDDLELLLREIDEFNLAISNNKPLDIPQSLENYLQFVAKSGNTVFPWPHVRNLIRTKMVNAIQQFQEPTCPNETFVLERFDLFRLAAPFTVQRLTELILQPTRHYRKKEKFLRGLEKTVLVVSTIEPHSLTNDEEKNGNDLNNTSASSCEAETETVTFNRTITLDPQDILTTSIRTSAIDVLNAASASENLVLDAVTTSAVGSAVAVIDQSISVTTGGLLAESISSSDVSSIDIITTDKPIPVTSEGIISESVSNISATVVASMESDKAQEALSSSIDVINQSSSESMIIDPVVATTVTTAVDESVSNVSATAVASEVSDEAQDALSSSIDVNNQSSSESMIIDPVVATTVTTAVDASGSVGTESFATSAVSSVDIVASDKTIPMASDCGIPDAMYESATAEQAKTQDILTTSIRTSAIDVLNAASASENLVLDAVTTSAVGSAVAVIDQNVGVTTGSLLAESISSSDVSSIDVISTDKPISVTSEGIILESVSTVAPTVVASMESDEAQDVLSSSIDVTNQSSSESMIIDPVVANTVTTAVDATNQNICVSSASVGTESFATSAVDLVASDDKTIPMASDSV